MHSISPNFAPGLPSGTKNRRLVTLVQAGSLLATGWMVWTVSLIPRLQRQTLGELLLHVLGYSFLAWTWSTVVALGLYAIVPIEERSEMVPNVLHTAATAVWFAPAMILLSEFSPAALLVALVLVVYTSRLLYAQWRLGDIGGAPLPRVQVREPGEFADCQLSRAFVWRERLPALAVAFCLQMGVVAVTTHYPLVGAAWLCLGTAMLTVFSMSSGALDAGQPPTLPKSILGIGATVVLAALLGLATGHGFGKSLVGGVGDRNGTQTPGLVEAARAVLRQLFYGEVPSEPAAKGPAVRRPPSAADTGALGGYPGVILWPEVKSVVTLVAPVMGTSLLQGRPAQPLGIPFAGEYWMFRWPFARPPVSSFFQRGSPTKMAFSSTDHTPLQMEAHQKLDTPIDLHCCRGIQLEVANTDRYPGTLQLELVLMNTEPARPALLRLGSAPVTSRPDLSRDPVMPVGETLEFTVPAQPSMDQFNEFKIVFQRTPPAHG